METFYAVVLYVLTGLLGVCVGSFLNVVIYRVPLGMSLAKPASHCPKCNYVLHWYDNIPVISYLILGGRCRKCRERISFRYTLVELSNMLLWLLSAALFWEKSIPFAIVSALASSILICVFFIDLEHQLVFDRFVLMLAALGVVAVFFDPYYGWLSHVIGGVGGFAAFALVSLLFYLIRKKEGLGFGDVKLTAACGLILGWERLLLAVLGASVIASIVIPIWSERRRRAKERAEAEQEVQAESLGTAEVAEAVQEPQAESSERVGAPVLAETTGTAETVQEAQAEGLERAGAPDFAEPAEVAEPVQAPQAEGSEPVAQAPQAEITEPAEIAETVQAPQAEITELAEIAETAQATQPENKDTAEAESGEESAEDFKNRGEYPFAPFLSAMFILSMLIGHFIVSAYMLLF